MVNKYCRIQDGYRHKDASFNDIFYVGNHIIMVLNSIKLGPSVNVKRCKFAMVTYTLYFRASMFRGWT